MSVRVGVSGLTVELGGSTILRDVAFEVGAGEFLTLLGPSGSGKTTTLNVIAGFVRQSAGSVAFDDVVMDDRPPRLRGTGFVFQSYALFPHMTVADNVAFPLRARKVCKADRRRLVADALELVDLAAFGKRPIRSLSGGQQQRVAIARALVFRPQLLLLDEPLAALDKRLRETMQVELKRIQHEVGVTTVAVTHDQTEALTMSNRVGIMRDGVLEQLDAPESLYQRPQSLFVARFLGEANILPVDADGYVASLATRVDDGPGSAVVRPEQLEVRAEDAVEGGEAVVEQIDFQGIRYRVQARLVSGGLPVIVSIPIGDPVAAEPGMKVRVVLADPRRVHVIRAVVDATPELRQMTRDARRMQPDDWR